MWQEDKTSQVGVDYVGCTQILNLVQATLAITLHLN